MDNFGIVVTVFAVPHPPYPSGVAIPRSVSLGERYLGKNPSLQTFFREWHQFSTGAVDGSVALGNVAYAINHYLDKTVAGYSIDVGDPESYIRVYDDTGTKVIGHHVDGALRAGAQTDVDVTLDYTDSNGVTSTWPAYIRVLIEAVDIPLTPKSLVVP